MYGKLFKQMYEGSLVEAGWEAVVTLQNLVILASDTEGVVDMTAEAIARTTTIPLEIIKAGLVALERADPDSRTPDEEGRRIVRLSDSRSWGWRIVNYPRYRNLRSGEERRDYHRQYWRDKRSPKINAQPDSTAPQPDSTHSTKAVSSKQDALSTKQKTTEPDGSDITTVLAHYQQLHPRRKITGPKPKALVARALKEFATCELIEAIDANANDTWSKETRKHELSWVLRDVDQINHYRDLAAKVGSDDEARRLWKLIKSEGIHHHNTGTEIDADIAALVQAGQINDATSFRAVLNRIPLHGLQKVSTEAEAVAYIARSLANRTPHGAGAVSQ